MIIRKFDEDKTYSENDKYHKDNKIYKIVDGNHIEDPAGYTYEINLKIRRRIK